MLHLLLIFVCIFLGSCDVRQEFWDSPDEEWCNSTATITQVEPDTAEGYWYTIEYDIPESSAINAEGKKITGPIQQHSLDKKEPILNQKIPLQYLKEEPIMFKLLESIKFEHTQE